MNRWIYSLVIGSVLLLSSCKKDGDVTDKPYSLAGTTWTRPLSQAEGEGYISFRFLSKDRYQKVRLDRNAVLVGVEHEGRYVLERINDKWQMTFYYNNGGRTGDGLYVYFSEGVMRRNIDVYRRQ